MTARILQRSGILIERNPNYAAMARKRIETEGGIFASVDLVLPAEAAE